MPLSTYTDLKAAIADYAVRSDLTTQIADFVTLAETMFNHGDDELGFPALRVREMETTSSSNTPDANGVITLDTDFLQMRRVTSTDDPRRILAYASPEWMDESYPTATSGYPSFYTIIGSSLIIRPVGSSDIEYVYYEKIPALSGSVSSNWLLAKSPNAYLFASLYNLYVFVQQPEGAASMLELARRACGALVGADKFSRAGSYAVRAGGPAP
jgi:hypothetical protein